MLDANLYLITDDLRSRGRSVIEVVSAALRGGIGCVQYRPWEKTDAEFLNNALKLRAITSAAGAKLIINARCDIAALADADGVHLGTGKVPVKAARKILGAKKIIGFSAHNLKETLKAQDDGADYISLSPLFITTSASIPRPPLGIKQWLKITEKIKIPVFALGGINTDNLKSALNAGINRIAVVSALTDADDITTAAKILTKIMSSRRRHAATHCKIVNFI
ncbi:MAG: thiamine phosphate synthase [bacterium]